MEPRFNMFDNEIGAKFGKRFAHASLVIAQSPLPKSAQELAALALAEEGTRLADAYRGVSDETWARVRKHYDDDQIAALVCLVAMINATNRLMAISNYQGGSYEPGMFASLTN